MAGPGEWLDAYGSAWETRDAQAAADLFTKDAIYQWGPFGRKLRGRVMIREAWADAVETQANIEFGYEVIGAHQRGAIARWWCSADESGGRWYGEGIFRLAFDDSGLCTSLEEWFNSKHEPHEAAP